MNILRYLMLALCLVCLAALVIVMCAGMSGSSLMIGGYDMGLFNFSFGSSGMTWGGEFDGETAPDGEISFACGDVKSVDLNWIGGDLEVKRHAEDVVLVVQTAKQGDIPEDRLLAYRLGTNGVLYLREGRSRRVTSNGETNVTLYLPEGFVFEANPVPSARRSPRLCQCHFPLEILRLSRLFVQYSAAPHFFSSPGSYLCR